MSEEPSTTETVTAVVWAPSTAVSSTPVTVTVWAVFQLELVNVNWAGDTVASPVSFDVALMTTSEDGWVLSTTANVAVVPVSDTVAVVQDTVPVVPDRVKAAVSLSVVVIETVWVATDV